MEFSKYIRDVIKNSSYSARSISKKLGKSPSYIAKFSERSTYNKSMLIDLARAIDMEDENALWDRFVLSESDIDVSGSIIISCKGVKHLTDKDVLRIKKKLEKEAKRLVAEVLL